MRRRLFTVQTNFARAILDIDSEGEIMWGDVEGSIAKLDKSGKCEFISKHKIPTEKDGKRAPQNVTIASWIKARLGM